jgi:aminomethyltransferase
MGYVDAPHAVDGTAVSVEIRGRDHPAVVAPMPFVPHRYFRKSAA